MQPNIPSEGLHVESYPNCSGEVGKAIDVKELTQYKLIRSDSMPYNTPPSCLLAEKAAQVVQGSSCGSYSSVTFGFPIDLVDATRHENQVGTNIVSGAPHVGMTSGCKDPNLHEHVMKNQVLNNNTSSSALATEAERLISGQSYTCLDSSSYQNEVFQLEGKCESSRRLDALISSGYPFAGSELLEALGSGFKQTSRGGHEELVKSEHASTTGPTCDMSHSQLTFDPGPENLLDAVVANVCHSDGNARDDILSSRSVHSLLTSMAEPSGQKMHSVAMMKQLPLAEVVDTQQNPSDICGAFSSIGFSSTCPSSSSDQFQTSLEMPKKIKKRAKPGESSRPRPRDRQLIQDRIKELRELVPNGSKV